MPTSFNTPSNTAVVTQSNWSSSNAVYNMLKPQNDTNEVHPWGSQDITGLFEKLGEGAKNYVPGSNGRHFEEDRLHMVVHAVGTTVGSLGAVTYTIDSGDTIGSFPAVNLPYIATGTAGFPTLGGPTLIPVRVHEVLVFPGDIHGKVTAVNASAGTFTATPTGSTDLPTIAATDEIWSIGLSTPEGFEEQIDSENWREHVVSWKSEIMVDAHKTTGTAMTQETWIEFSFRGKKKYNWWYKGQENAFKKFRNYRELKWVFGKAVTNATTLPTNYSAQYTQVSGLLDFAGSFGNNAVYDLTTGMTLNDFENIVINTLSKNAGAVENCLYESISFKKVVNDFLRNEVQNGSISYNMLSGQDAYLSLDFDHFKVLNYTFHDKVYSVFNDPTTAGNVSAAYTNFAFLCPMENNMYRCVEKEDKVSVPPMRINYLKQGDDSREWIETLTGGAIKQYTNNSDVAKIDFRSENSPEFFGANRWLTVTGSNL